MRALIIKAVILLGILFVLLAALLACIRFYPYSYDFSTYPTLSHTKSGAAGDPINVLFIGRNDQILQSFHSAGWLTPDPITTKSSMRIAVDSLAHRSYPTAPVSNLYVYGRVQDLAFEKPTSDVQNRGHIRIWKTGSLIDGQSVWVGAATYDSGIEVSGTTHLPTHHIAPTVDLERNVVGTDLATTGLVREEAYTAFTPPIFSAHNGGGDYYESDGTILVISYTLTHIPLHQPAWAIEGMKTGIFLFYDSILTIVVPLMPLLVLAVSLIAGLVVWRFAARNRFHKKT
ncbi:MAG: LssY C-terminal domain-containing protein [Ktedonobacteraceae bacterium]